MNNFNQRKNNYNKEKQTRWNMALNEDSFANNIANSLSKITNTSITSSRFDSLWHQRFNPEQPENSWVKGCPDFYLNINNSFLYLELKIKENGVFRKTLTGGTTKDGSFITNYGCESFYLDIDPVYKNMILFCNKANIDKKSFILAFYNNENSTYVISLAKIQRLINEGWTHNNQNISICEYSEGYGRKTYLIPLSKTTLLQNLSLENLLKCSQNILSLPHNTNSTTNKINP